MTDNDIKHFLTLRKKVNSAMSFWLFLTVVCLANALFQFHSIFEPPASLLISAVFAYNAFLSFLKSSENDKSYALIEKLINRDPELVQQLNRSKDV